MNFMKKIGLLLMTVFMVTAVSAQDQKPQSPKATATGKINNATITINYSSPSVRDRPIWGSLVPYGMVWRAGANATTTFETDKALMVEGKELPAGKYAFYILPSEGKATIIFGKDPSIGAGKYDKSTDQLRVDVKLKKSKTMNEALLYTVNKNNVTLSWENFDIPISIK
jgi:hypothetical protein